MKWEKKGRIFQVDNISDWMYSHAADPFAEQLKDDIFRIYFTTRDKKNRSHGAFIDINLENPEEILNISKDPLIKPGSLGSFDDSGAMPSCIVNYKNENFLYYSGWTLGVTVPFYFYIGLAKCSDNDSNYQKYSQSPVLERNPVDPYLTASPFILIENNIWKMWYVSCEKWQVENKTPKHYYNIKYAESNNGIEWIRKGVTCIDFKNANEYAIARPCVIKENRIYKMWYSYRGRIDADTYRIGYAESNNGINWIRKDEEIGIDVSSQGWDSEMIAYPFVFTHKDIRYMLYNGNGYGKSGFGLAMLLNQ